MTEWDKGIKSKEWWEGWREAASFYEEAISKHAGQEVLEAVEKHVKQALKQEGIR